MCTHTSVVTPVTIRLVIRGCAAAARGRWRRSCPSRLVEDHLARAGRARRRCRVRPRPARGSVPSVPGCRSPSSSRPRASLLGGQSVRSGRWPSRVCTTIIPAARAASRTAASGSTTRRAARRRCPAARRTRRARGSHAACRSARSAVLAGSRRNSYGRAHGHDMGDTGRALPERGEHSCLAPSARRCIQRCRQWVMR